MAQARRGIWGSLNVLVEAISHSSESTLSRFPSQASSLRKRPQILGQAGITLQQTQKA